MPTVISSLGFGCGMAALLVGFLFGVVITDVMIAWVLVTNLAVEDGKDFDLHGGSVRSRNAHWLHVDLRLL